MATESVAVKELADEVERLNEIIVGLRAETRGLYEKLQATKEQASFYCRGRDTKEKDMLHEIMPLRRMLSDVTGGRLP